MEIKIIQTKEWKSKIIIDHFGTMDIQEINGMIYKSGLYYKNPKDYIKNMNIPFTEEIYKRFIEERPNIFTYNF